MSEGMLPEHADAVQVALDEARGLLVEGLSWQVEERSTEEDQGVWRFRTSCMAMQSKIVGCGVHMAARSYPTGRGYPCGRC